MRIVYNNRYGCIRICDKSKKKHVVGGLLGESPCANPNRQSGCFCFDNNLQCKIQQICTSSDTVQQCGIKCTNNGYIWCPN